MKEIAHFWLHNAKNSAAENKKYSKAISPNMDDKNTM